MVGLLGVLGCAAPPSPAETAPSESASAAPAPRAEIAPPAVRAQLDGRGFPDKVIALTWDDGPDAHTLELARYLHAENVQATFFVVGAWVDQLSEEPGRGRDVFATGHEHLPILGELVALGHRLGNHTRNHVLLGGAAPDRVQSQLGENQARLDAFLAGGLRLFRAPGGAWSAAASAAVDADPLTARLVGPIRWDVDGKDWEASLYCRSERPALECERAAPGRASRVKPAVTARRYLSAIDAAGHGIVLLHDRVGHVGSTYALDVARALIPELKARGHVFAAPVLRFSPLAPRSAPLPEPAAADPAADAWGKAEGCQPVLRGDLNGDGRPDVCGVGQGGVVCSLSTGHGFTKATTWLASEGIDAAGWRRETLRLVDVSGDGRADLCGQGREGIACGLAP